MIIIKKKNADHVILNIEIGLILKNKRRIVVINLIKIKINVDVVTKMKNLEENVPLSNILLIPYKRMNKYFEIIKVFSVLYRDLLSRRKMLIIYMTEIFLLLIIMDLIILINADFLCLIIGKVIINMIIVIRILLILIQLNYK